MTTKYDPWDPRSTTAEEREAIRKRKEHDKYLPTISQCYEMSIDEIDGPGNYGEHLDDYGGSYA